MIYKSKNFFILFLRSHKTKSSISIFFYPSSIDAFLSETNMENYETDLNEKQLIKQTQDWLVHLFSFKLLNTLIDNVNLILVRNNKNYTNDPNNFQLKSSLLPVICETINSLIDILYETKEEWRNYNIVRIFKTY